MIKWTKEGAILKRGYFDYSCRGLFYSNVSFWFHFYYFVDSSLLPQKQVCIGPSDFLKGICKHKCQTDELHSASVLHTERF